MKTVGLVLGSGGARGWAHIGVIRALASAGINIHFISGASIGAFVGAIYAAGELDDLEEFVRALDWKAVVSYFDVVFPSSGLLDGNRVYELLSDHLQDMAIEEADIQFCCVATDLLNGEEVRLQTGPMVDAVRASISIPGVFTPFQKNGQFLGDGGIVNPMPVDVMREMGADVVIAVNLNHTSKPGILDVDVDSGRESAPSDSSSRKDNTHSDSTAASGASQTVRANSDSSRSQAGSQNANNRNQDGSEPEKASAGDRSNFLATPNFAVRSRVMSVLEQIQQRYEAVQDRLQEKMEHWMPEEKQGMNIFDVIGASLSVMEQQVTQGKLRDCPPDILLEPNLSQYGIFDFHEADAIIQEGYRCMEQQLPLLQQKLSD